MTVAPHPDEPIDGGLGHAAAVHRQVDDRALESLRTNAHDELMCAGFQRRGRLQLAQVINAPQRIADKGRSTLVEQKALTAEMVAQHGAVRG